MSDTHSMLKNRKVCYFSGSGMRVPPPKKSPCWGSEGASWHSKHFWAHSLYKFPPLRDPSANMKTHVTYCTACFLWSPLIINTSMWTLLNLRIVIFSSACELCGREKDSCSCRRTSSICYLLNVSDLSPKGQCDVVEKWSQNRYDAHGDCWDSLLLKLH